MCHACHAVSVSVPCCVFAPCVRAVCSHRVFAPCERVCYLRTSARRSPARSIAASSPPPMDPWQRTSWAVAWARLAGTLSQRFSYSASCSSSSRCGASSGSVLGRDPTESPFTMVDLLCSRGADATRLRALTDPDFGRQCRILPVPSSGAGLGDGLDQEVPAGPVPRHRLRHGSLVLRGLR